MGTPLPPNEPGNDCALCWGVGKPFGDGPTPHMVNASLFMILPGEFWEPSEETLLLSSHQLIQHFGPCFWRVDDGQFVWIFELDGLETRFQVRRNSDNRPVFVGILPEICGTSIESGLFQPLGNVAFSGFANVVWSPGDLE